MTDSAPGPEGLVAVTRRLSTDVDLIDVAGETGVVWAHGRAGFGGRGVATRVTVPRHDPALAAKAVHEALDVIDVDDDVGVPGTGAVALGALAFDLRVEGELVVPELVVGRSADGTRWITSITAGGREPELPDPPPAPPSADEPTRYELTSERSPSVWCDAVSAARERLRGGDAQKVVLSRAVTVEADTDLSSTAILRRLRSSYPSCMLYSLEGLVGASPELLVARHGELVHSHPMAGTAPRSSDPTSDAQLAAGLLASTKDQMEHRLTIDMVHDTLLPWCSYLDEEAEPSIVAMANVQHLATRVEGRLSMPPASVIELMTALHPTPAVCGAPRERALELIAEYEQLDRGRFAGPVGWVDGAGNGAWAVGIRCAEIRGRMARLFAGVGVLPDSDPSAELAETRAKLQALLSAILRP
jgi:menaquinone-specific isochorismate synthase